MNADFERTYASLASSMAGRALTYLGAAMTSAWQTSVTSAAARSCRLAWRAMAAASRLRTGAVAVIIAAALQPLLRLAMPATVVPALPWSAFAVAAIFSAAIAWQAPAIIKAWPTSAVARLLRR